ncbi:hypothetical protein HYDPIDRAFT_188842 [Hydnomerulius pinastri MD-312]|uniref:Uncharacterized protein n=1 Tax=Hydnomerulius pinastri MD-312 TaxID=994086 RepID=A0A0C9W749_9AGAM|nr:hypothetical protein HYDPIDRAFT_188842 [Hydnomerulius pinastri MD-312]
MPKYTPDLFGGWHEVPPTTVHPSQLHYRPSSSTQSQTQQQALTQHNQRANRYATPTPGYLLTYFRIAALRRRNAVDYTHPNGLWQAQQMVAFRHPQYAAAPVGSQGLIGNWGRPDPNDVLRIPVGDVEFPPVGSRRKVDFDCLPRGVPGVQSEGTSMIDILYHKGSTMEGPHDIVLQGLGQEKEKLYISWPGYHPYCHSISTVGKDGRPVTRLELADNVSRAYVNFFHKIDINGSLPCNVGHYNISLHQGRHARDDSFGIQFEQLHLVGIRQTTKGSWVALVDVV